MADTQPSGKGSPGQTVTGLPATVWNNMVSAGQAWSDQQLGNQSGSVTRDRSTDSIKAKNTTSDRRRGEILGEFTTGLLTEITPEHIWLNGTTPTTGKSFGILKYPCKADDIAACQVSGVCIAWVNVTDAAHNYAEVTTGNFVLQSADSGPIEILGNPGVGELECAVRFAPVSSGSCKIFRAPDAGIAAVSWDEMADELTVTNAECQEYAWNAGGTKLLPVTRVEVIEEVPTDVPVKYTVANPFYGRVPGSVCIPTGFTEDAEVCEDDPLPDVPELDPPCEYDTREMSPFFFFACKLGPHYIPTQPLMPTKRVHVLQRPQLQEDMDGLRTLVFPMYEVRLPVPIHDGCEPLPFAVCGPAGAAVPCE